MDNLASLHVMQHLNNVVAAAGETVAIKSVDASNFRSIAQIDQIQDEISVLSGLKHPCIIRLLDMHFTNNIFYFVMEYASGGCLVDYVRKQVGRLWPRSMYCVAQTLLGMSSGVFTYAASVLSNICAALIGRCSSVAFEQEQVRGRSINLFVCRRWAVCEVFCLTVYQIQLPWAVCCFPTYNYFLLLPACIFAVSTISCFHSVECNSIKWHACPCMPEIITYRV